MTAADIDLDPDEQAERLTPIEQLQIIHDDLIDALNDARIWLAEAASEVEQARLRVMFLAGQAQTYRVAIDTLAALQRDLADDIAEPDTLTTDDTQESA